MGTQGRHLLAMAAVVAAMGGLLFGFDTGVISGALLLIRKQFSLGHAAQEILVSSVLVGCMAGAALAGPLVDRLGRRRLILATAALFALGSVWCASAHSVHSLVAARVMVGLAIGAASFAVPLYLSEIAPAQVRGAIVSLNQLMITVGILVSYGVDEWFSAAPQGWRDMFLAALVPALALFAGMLFLPGSPRWLLSRGRVEEARHVHARLGADPADFEEMRRSLAAESQPARQPSRPLREPWLRPALLVGVGIMFVQQATGINTVIYYAPSIFQMAGFASDKAAIGATVGVGAVNVLFTLVSIRLVDRVGRKPLLSLGLVGMTLSLAVLGAAFHWKAQLGTELRWVAVGSLFVYISAFAVSLGPVAWLLISEIYPTRVRGAAMGLATLCNWAFNFIIALTFLSIVDLLGPGGAFWLYALVGAGGWIFCRLAVPETRGVALERIEENLRRGRPMADIGLPTQADPEGAE